MAFRWGFFTVDFGFSIVKFLDFFFITASIFFFNSRCKLFFYVYKKAVAKSHLTLLIKSPSSA